MVDVLVPVKGGFYKTAKVIEAEKEPCVQIGTNGTEAIPGSSYNTFPIFRRLKATTETEGLPYNLSGDDAKKVATEGLEKVIALAEEFGENNRVPAVAIISSGNSSGDYYRTAYADVVCLVENKPQQ